MLLFCKIFNKKVTAKGRNKGEISDLFIHLVITTIGLYLKTCKLNLKEDLPTSMPETYNREQ